MTLSRATGTDTSQSTRVLSPNAYALALLLFASLLCFYQLGLPSFGVDESMDLLNCRSGLKSALFADPNPPLYHVLLFIITRFSSAEWAARLPAALAGALTAPLLYLLVRRLVGENEARIAGLLMAASAMHHDTSQLARMYGTLTFLSVASFYMLVVALQTCRVRDWACYTLVTALLPYTHDVGATVILSEWLAIMGASGIASLWKTPFLKSQIAVLVLYLPWLPQWLSHVTGVHVVSHQVGGDLRVAGSTLFAAWMDFTAAYYRGLFRAPNIDQVALPVAVSCVLACCMGLVSLHSNRKALAMLAVWIVVPAVVLFVLACASWFHLTHYAIAGLPAYVALIAIGLIQWRTRKTTRPLADLTLISLVGLNLCAIYNMHYVPEYGSADWRGVTRHIESNHREDDLIVLVGRWTDYPLVYYHRKPMRWIHVPAHDSPSSEAVSHEMRTLVQRPVERVWLISSGQQPIVDPHHRVERWFRANARLVESRSFQLLPLKLFEIIREPNAPGSSS